MINLKIILVLLFLNSAVTGQQVADSTFIPETLAPAFEKGKGPVVYIDEAHNNFHTAGGRFQVFARLLEADGYNVRPSVEKINPDIFGDCNIYVISNAIADENVENWDKPNYSAFTEREVRVLNKWVKDGGCLLLIADHMPCPDASEKIALSFGVEFNNGYALPSTGRSEILKFNRTEGTLIDHPVTRGRSIAERIDSFASFTGQAFRIGDDVEPVLKIKNGYVSLMPEKSWEFNEDTRVIDVSGWYQGAVMNYGKGRIAFFGEAAAFTAQLAGGKNPMGMNHPEASQNAQFVLNVMHWLSGLLDDN